MFKFWWTAPLDWVSDPTVVRVTLYKQPTLLAALLVPRQTGMVVPSTKVSSVRSLMPSFFSTPASTYQFCTIYFPAFTVTYGVISRISTLSSIPPVPELTMFGEGSGPFHCTIISLRLVGRAGQTPADFTTVSVVPAGSVPCPNDPDVISVAE